MYFSMEHYISACGRQQQQQPPRMMDALADSLGSRQQ
jgi:hypothetical protein